ncbi:hypothetical protein BH24PSE2_BH24PSE2_07970 [soil metagenome]
MLALVGIAVLALLFADVFLTVFHAQGHGGPLSRVQNRTIWALFRTAGARAAGAPGGRRWL